MKLGECIQVLIKIYGSNWVKGHRSQRSNLCVFSVGHVLFSVCSPTSPRSLGRSSPNLVGRLRAAPDISSRGSLFKGQGHRGQRSNFCISAVLGPICMIFFLNSVLRPFQDYFSSYETGQSVGGRKRENPEKNHLAHPQAELGLSHMWPERGSNPL